jgi:CHAT domain-containing protein
MQSKLLDYAISSYTPTLTALIQASRPCSAVQKEPQLLLVAQPSAFGQVVLPGTKEELDRIQKHTRNLPVLRLVEHTATVENVIKGLKECSWVHFACHGIQEVAHPTESSLLLAGNSRLTLTDIIKLSLIQADFAFLSACQTATGTEELSEEAIHLAVSRVPWCNCNNMVYHG